MPPMPLALRMTPMIVRILHGARRLDATLARSIGPAYHVILAVGLVIEIVRQIREFGDIEVEGAVRTAATIIFFSILLLHQVAELAEHADRRRRKTGDA
jgi:hypothetical protein